MQPAQTRAPYVTFQTRPEEDRTKSIQLGVYSTKDVDYAIITPAGSKDRVERRVDDWFTHLAQQIQEDRFPAPWLEAYRFKYKEWKAGREIPTEGTPILNWPVISPAQAENCVSLKIMTVEDLAVANEEAIGRLGMGGRTLQQHAKNFLAMSKDAQVSGRLTNLENELEALKAKNEQLQGENAVLEQRLNAGQEAQPKSDNSLGGKTDTELENMLKKF